MRIEPSKCDITDWLDVGGSDVVNWPVINEALDRAMASEEHHVLDVSFRASETLHIQYGSNAFSADYFWYDRPLVDAMREVLKNADGTEADSFAAVIVSTAYELLEIAGGLVGVAPDKGQAAEVIASAIAERARAQAERDAEAHKARLERIAASEPTFSVDFTIKGESLFAHAKGNFADHSRSKSVRDVLQAYIDAETAGDEISPLARASFASLASTLREMADKMDAVIT